MCGLVFDWMNERGGLEGIENINNAKATLLYDAIDNSDGFFL
jgi:phosphoserine aminotransferase